MHRRSIKVRIYVFSLFTNVFFHWTVCGAFQPQTIFILNFILCLNFFNRVELLVFLLSIAYTTFWNRKHKELIKCKQAIFFLLLHLLHSCTLLTSSSYSYIFILLNIYSFRFWNIKVETSLTSLLFPPSHSLWNENIEAALHINETKTSPHRIASCFFQRKVEKYPKNRLWIGIWMPSLSIWKKELN